MKNLFAFIKKPSDILEIYSIIKFYKVKNITLYINNCSWATSKDLKKYTLIKLNKLNNNIKIIENNHSSLKNINWFNKLKKFKLIAIPANQYSFFYSILNKLKQNNIKTILISDGVVDILYTFKFLLATNRLIPFISYKFLKYFFLFNVKTDECFFTLYPLKAKFSKISKPVSNTYLPDKNIVKLLKKSKVKNLVIGGKGLTISDFKKKFNFRNYCYTYRQNKPNGRTSLTYLIINGKKIKLDNILLAEEIINTKLINNVYSYLGTSAFYALQKNISVTIFYKKYDPYLSFYFLKKNFISLLKSKKIS